jgi:hypothetical protein
MLALLRPWFLFFIGSVVDPSGTLFQIDDGGGNLPPTP